MASIFQLDYSGQQINSLLDVVDTLYNPVGAVMMFNSYIVPSYCVRANGQALSRITDSQLFEFGSQSSLYVEQSLKDADPVTYAMFFGTGDGATTFTIPNYELGHFLRGPQSGVTSIGQIQGDAIRNITAEVDYITDINTTIGSLNFGSGAFVTNANAGAPEYSINDVTSPYENQGKLTFNASRVVPTADENRPKSATVLVCLHRGLSA